jgi:5-methylcytosine-specific restriction endonuclease McrA
LRDRDLTEKRCSQCSLVKPVGEFFWNVRKWSSRCKACLVDAVARKKARELGTPLVELVDRPAIVARDNSTCYLCHRQLSGLQITLDHVIPLTRGGAHTASNLRVACRSCNSSKGELMPDEYAAKMALTKR